MLVARQRALRRAAGYTQQQLADEIGVSRRQIAYYESESPHPPANLLVDLAEALDVTTDTLLGRTPTRGRAKLGSRHRHERRLGSPKTLRHRLYADGDYKRFFREFGKHLDRQQDLLETLAAELTGNVVLICYEKDYRTCHRSAVANALGALTGTVPTHLEVTDEQARHATYPDLGQGFSPA